MLERNQSWARRLAINTVMAALALAAALFPGRVDAQTSAKQPFFLQNQQWLDLGNGPSELLPLEGNGVAYTSGGGGTGTSAGTTALTLTATPATGFAPCVGCVITCAPSNSAVCTIPAATTVTAFNGTTGVTTSVATTVTAATLVWGAACPAATAVNVPGVSPNTVPQLSAPLNLRQIGGSNMTALPLYSTARMCLYGGLQAGVTALQFPVGAH